MITTIINVMKEAPTSNAAVQVAGNPRIAPSTTAATRIAPRRRVAHG
jgi:hypothetical protein